MCTLLKFLLLSFKNCTGIITFLTKDLLRVILEAERLKCMSCGINILSLIPVVNIGLILTSSAAHKGKNAEKKSFKKVQYVCMFLCLCIHVYECVSVYLSDQSSLLPFSQPCRDGTGDHTDPDLLGSEST